MAYINYITLLQNLQTVQNYFLGKQQMGIHLYSKMDSRDSTF